MNISFYIAHPSQYYVFRQLIYKLHSVGHKTYVFIKTKDILEDLLIKDDIPYLNIFPRKKSSGSIRLFFSVLVRNTALVKLFNKERIDLLVTSASDSCQASYLMGIPSIVLNDDDASVIKKSVFFGWPFSSVIIAPKSCEMGYWSKKTIFYSGYQKLFYLHQNYFKPDISIVRKYILSEKPYILIRSVNLNAHHDKNIRGLTDNLIKHLFQNLSNYANIYIFSERFLPEEFEKHKLQINPLHIHHLIYFAKLIISDSQSMTHEAAIMGTPSIRYNDLVGRIGVLEELEHKYELTLGITTDKSHELIQKAEEIAISKNNNSFRIKAQLMRNEMIDPVSFLLWFIDNYPASKKIMKKNPDYQYRFI